MGLHQLKSYLSVEDYLAGEKESRIRHEYVYGQVYAMAGTSDRHNLIAGNIYARLSDHLEDAAPCAPFISDMKVEVDENNYYYPDVVVACDPPGGDPYLKTQPRLIVEVLSPTTARIDRHEKLPAYQRVAGLKECLLIAQDQMLIEVHRYSKKGKWQTEILTQPDEQLHLESVGLTLSLAQIYRRVRFEEEAE